MTVNQHSKPGLEGEDKYLVDLVTAVLVDPNIHTDTRMRLDHEITDILVAAHEPLRRRRAPHHRPAVVAPHADGASDLLASALVDPNLHTDTRMRIHHEISQILRDASASGSGRPSGAPPR